jgi:hypothetical protein
LAGKAKKFPNTKKLKMKPPITIILHFLMYKFSEKRMKKDPKLFNSLSPKKYCPYIPAKVTWYLKFQHENSSELNVLLDFLNAYRDDYAACFGT